MRLIKLLRPHAQLFTGETGGWPDDEAAHLVAEKIGIYADEAQPPEPEKPKEPWVFNAKTDVFVTDGLTRPASQALHQVDIHTADDVRKFIESTPEGESPLDRLIAIDGVNEQSAQKLMRLYGAQPE